MAIKVISDIHGAYKALAEQLEPTDTAVLLGDYLNLVDFRTLDGILSEVYSREEIRKALASLEQGDRDQAKRSIQELAGSDEQKRARVRELVGESYHAFFRSIPCRCLMIYGNTDNPAMLRELASGDVEIIESGVVRLNGERFGFVSGSPHSKWTVGLPGEMDNDSYAKMVEALGPVDVLCTHFPPAVPELTWDRLAERDEMGSEALLAYLEEFQPARHYFGHVHNPRQAIANLGPTTLVNAGFFKEQRTALIHKD